MRIAFIHPFLYRFARGIERYTINLANVLTRHGLQVDILTWRWPQPIVIDAVEPGVRVHLLSTRRYFATPAMIPLYVWELWRNQYDLVWIFFAGYGEAEALTLVRKQRFGIVFHFPYQQVPHRYREFLRFHLAQRAAPIVSVSQFVAEGVSEFFGRASAVIPNGVDARRFAPAPAARARLRESLGLAPDAPLLVTAAALEESKGVQWVLGALSHLVGEFPRLTYLVLGEGRYRARLEELARALNLTQHVHFLGAQADVAPFYQAADLAPTLFVNYASSLATLEALACGVPVIAARRRPFDELITPACGVEVNEQDPFEVALAIRGLLGDPERRRAMGQAGRVHILNHFTWDAIAQRYVELMERSA